MCTLGEVGRGTKGNRPTAWVPRPTSMVDSSNPVSIAVPSAVTTRLGGIAQEARGSASFSIVILIWPRCLSCLGVRCTACRRGLTAGVTGALTASFWVCLLGALVGTCVAGRQ